MVGRSGVSRGMPSPLVALPCGSRSTRSTRFSWTASDEARLTAVVVLPTPPFWLTTARTSAIGLELPWWCFDGVRTTGVRQQSRRRAADARGRRPQSASSRFETAEEQFMKIACVLGQGFEDSEFRIPY